VGDYGVIVEFSWIFSCFNIDLAVKCSCILLVFLEETLILVFKSDTMIIIILL